MMPVARSDNMVPRSGNMVLNLRLSFITAQDQVLFTQLFKSAAETKTTLSGEKARDLLLGSGLDKSTLSYIWFVSPSLLCGILANVVGLLLIPQDLGISTFLNSH
jgi:hypothetical protein